MTLPVDTWVQLTGWALIHSVWQAAAVALALAVALRVFRSRSAELRYALACTGLLVAIAAPILTVALSERSSRTPSEVRATREDLVSGSSSSPQIAAVEDGSRQQTTAVASPAVLDDWLPAVVWTWLAGVTLLLVRSAGGFWHVRRLRLQSLTVAPSPLQATADRVACASKPHSASSS
jgi:hypothetical protein